MEWPPGQIRDRCRRSAASRIHCDPQALVRTDHGARIALAAHEAARPVRQGEVEGMGCLTASFGKRYGVKQVCPFGEPTRSCHDTMPWDTPPVLPRRWRSRAPLPEIADSAAALMAASKADLASCPFFGEGYRRVWVRLAGPGWETGQAQAGALEFSLPGTTAKG